MNALPGAAVPPMPSSAATPRVAGIGVLRALLLGEAALGLVLAIGLSMLASGLDDRSTEQTVRFAAGFSLLFAIFAAAASRGARRRRPWSWTLAALLQLVLAVGTGIAILVATWYPGYLVGFALAAIVMVVLSTPSVRRALGQD
jgi:peptidoglycan/LPS O-acetylase OafA/YrhL